MFAGYPDPVNPEHYPACLPDPVNPEHYPGRISVPKIACVNVYLNA
jgi:hypothetical protein